MRDSGQSRNLNKIYNAFIFPLIMDWFSISLILVGLILFEVISSIDNAIISAEVLSTMSDRAKRWFLLWGILIAVFLVRGILPFLILWMSNPELSISEVFTAGMSSDS